MVITASVEGAEVAEAGGLDEAVVILRRTPHDVAVADVGTPRREGTQLLREIRSTCPDLAVILLSAYDDGESVRAALSEGASGYVLKDAAPEDLAQAVRVARSRSGNMLSSRAARNLFAGGADPSHAVHLDSANYEGDRAAVRGAKRPRGQAGGGAVNARRMNQ